MENKDQRISEALEEKKLSSIKDSSDDAAYVKDDPSILIDGKREALKQQNGDFVVDIGKPKCKEDHETERVCRICHLGSESGDNESELIALGCDCKEELGTSHRHCADAWFTQRGNRLCEICGKTVKNISDVDNAEDMSIFMLDWNEVRLVVATLDTSRESSRRCKIIFLNFFLVCLVLLFVIAWFHRGLDIS